MTLSLTPRAAPETPGPGGAASQPAPADTDNRTAQRIPASAVPSITGLRLSPRAVAAVLVNISSSGLLAECAERLQTGSKVTVFFDGTFVPPSAEGRVARNSVSSMSPNGRLQYHVGISFTQPIKLDVKTTAEQAEVEPVAKPADPEPVPDRAAVRNRW